MIASPIYLLDFRNGKVSELDPTDEVGQDKGVLEPQPMHPSGPGVRFAALGSPVEHKD